MKRTCARVAVFALVAVAMLHSPGGAAGQRQGAPGAGSFIEKTRARSAPQVRVVDLKGLEAAIAAERGKAVLVNFWAIWCQPCVAELPQFLAVGRAYRARNAAIITVSYDLMVPDVTKDGVLKQVRAFVAARKIDAPVLIYDAADYDAINQRFGLPGPVPVTIAFDAAGHIVERHAGQATREQFEGMMRTALTRPSGSPPRSFPGPGVR